MPFDGPHGPHARVQYFPLAAGAAFEEGEPVRLIAAGEVDDVAGTQISSNDNIVGFAAGTGDTTNASGLGSFRVFSLGQFTPGDGAATAGDLVGVYMPDPSTYFITARQSADGAAFAAPVATIIGDEAGLIELGGNWGVDTSGAGAENVVRVMDVLDADGVSISLSGGAGVFTVFALLAHQMAPDAGVVNAPA
jgi:hypothetical protein